VVTTGGRFCAEAATETAKQKEIASASFLVIGTFCLTQDSLQASDAGALLQADRSSQARVEDPRCETLKL
jgi:hypothetical protein